MKTSTERILTTHVGSLSRPDELVALMFAKAEGETVDAALLERKTRDAVIEVVAHQREVGIDIVSDGEMSKPSYATCVTERLTGFGGISNLPKLSDILEYPNVAKVWFTDPGVQSLNRNRPARNGPVSTKGIDDVAADIAWFRRALDLAPPEDAFMTAASPGLVSMFLSNVHYDTEGECQDAPCLQPRSLPPAQPGRAFLQQTQTVPAHRNTLQKNSLQTTSP